MTFAIRRAQSADLDPVVAIAAACPEAPQWPRSAYEPYLTLDPTDQKILRAAFVAESSDPTRSDAGFESSQGHEAQASPEQAANAVSCASNGPGRQVLLAFAAVTLLWDGVQNLCQLDSIAVLPHARRHGVGSALLLAILRWATQNGALHFSLEVRASNAAAIALYQRFGLSAEGRRTRYYADPEEDALLWGTKVTAGTL